MNLDTGLTCLKAKVQKLFQFFLLINNMNIDKTLNLLGLKCPEPLFRTRFELEEMKKGQVIKLIVDDPASENDIRNLIRYSGHELVNFEWDDQKVVFWIRVN